MRAPGRRFPMRLLLLLASLAAACVSNRSPSPRDRHPAPVDLNAPVVPRSAAAHERCAAREVTRAEALRYSHIEQLLADRLPMLDVIPRGYGRFSLRVRGRPTPPESVGPLVVIDGMPFGEGGAEMLATIAPRDVRCVEVLRDVSATSAYGRRGANGVVVVTLRRTRS
jgi:TonB-dependent SusC/RagA subfamily outer membrane receptor